MVLFDKIERVTNNWCKSNKLRLYPNNYRRFYWTVIIFNLNLQEKFVKQIGGSTSEDAIINTMAKVFRKKCARKYTWKDKNDNKAAAKGLPLIISIKGVYFSAILFPALILNVVHSVDKLKKHFASTMRTWLRISIHMC